MPRDHQESEEEIGKHHTQPTLRVASSDVKRGFWLPVVAHNNGEYAHDWLTDCVEVVQWIDKIISSSEKIGLLNVLCADHKFFINVKKDVVREELHSQKCKDEDEDEKQQAEDWSISYATLDSSEHHFELEPNTGQAEHPKQSEGPNWADKLIIIILVKNDMEQNEVNDRHQHDRCIQDVEGVSDVQSWAESN